MERPASAGAYVGRGNVILHHAQRLAFACQPQHQFRKIAARRAQTARPEDPEVRMMIGHSR